MGANQYTVKGAPKRDSPIPVRLTSDEHKRARELAAKYGTTVADILRSGLDSFEREHNRDGGDECATHYGEPLPCRVCARAVK